MKLLFISDVHIDNQKRNDKALWTKTRKIWLHFVSQAIEHKVDALVVAGDLFDSGKPYPEAISSVKDGLELADRAGLKVILISGNHEKHNWPKHHRHLYEVFNGYANVEIAIKPRNISVGDYQISALPYLTIPEVRDIHPSSRPEDVLSLLSVEMSRQIERLSDEGSDILVGHATVMGAKYGVERELTLSSSFFKEALVDIEEVESLYENGAIFGHIHTAQPLGEKSRYIGSPYQIDFSEEGMEKGAILYEDGNVIFLPTPKDLSRNFITYRARESFADDIRELEDRSLEQIMRVVIPFGEADKIDLVRAVCDEVGIFMADVKLEGKKISNSKVDLGDTNIISTPPVDLLIGYLNSVAKSKNLAINEERLQKLVKELS
jgi:exonuclease SbcD